MRCLNPFHDSEEEARELYEQRLIYYLPSDQKLHNYTADEIAEALWQSGEGTHEPRRVCRVKAKLFRAWHGNHTRDEVKDQIMRAMKQFWPYCVAIFVLDVCVLALCIADSVLFAGTMKGSGAVNAEIVLRCA